MVRAEVDRQPVVEGREITLIRKDGTPITCLNTAAAGGYVTVDARLGLRLRQYTIAVQGQNLTNRRDPVTASEFGDQSYYLLPARQLMLSI